MAQLVGTVGRRHSDGALVARFANVGVGRMPHEAWRAGEHVEGVELRDAEGATWRIAGTYLGDGYIEIDEAHTTREGHAPATRTLQDIARDLIALAGDDPEREGLRDTPDRFAKWWAEFFNYADDNTGTAFESVTTDQLVLVGPVRLWSLCEHHLLPFSCDVTMGVLTGEKVLGLSKYARIARVAAHRLQLQERLVDEIADALVRASGSEHVAVYGRGAHLCMQMRGVRSEALMTTSALRGAFHTDASLRAEFLLLARGGER